MGQLHIANDSVQLSTELAEWISGGTPKLLYTLLAAKPYNE
eukprot:gene2335-3038_t